MTVHLVDGTYELFRHYFAVPSFTTAEGREAGAVRGVLRSVTAMLDGGATHIAVATDHVVESFRNELWPGYKTGEGVPEDLFAQFSMLEAVLEVAGFAVWPMVDGEADDGLATGAAIAAADDRVGRVLICTPDKDLAQCVGGKVVQYDRRADVVRDRDGVRERFGVEPASIPDYLGLVGDTADGFPGLKGWGAKSASVVLARYRRLEDIPADPSDWDVSVRGAKGLAERLIADRELAELFRRIATVRSDSDEVTGTVDDWRWTGVRPEFTAWVEALDVPDVAAALAARSRSLVGGPAHDTSEPLRS
ncbi:MAG: flap endonuclease [Actinobacteria bacterium]|nr:flap endonuclease [Actinomycetota bacterium]